MEGIFTIAGIVIIFSANSILVLQKMGRTYKMPWSSLLGEGPYLKFSSKDNISAVAMVNTLASSVYFPFVL